MQVLGPEASQTRSFHRNGLLLSQLKLNSHLNELPIGRLSLVGVGSERRSYAFCTTCTVRPARTDRTH
jgi:hypothetical protein